MNTFSLTFLHKSLVERNAFIYHGAGIAKGLGSAATNALSYIDRLKNVIANDLEVCCSTVRPGDSELALSYWGRMGLILQPRSANSITLVSPSDAGTLPDPASPGRRQIYRRPITSHELVHSIDLRQPRSANEWCVLDYNVAGVFIEPPVQYVENGQLFDIDIPDVFSNFPGFRVYAFNGPSLSEVLPSKTWGKAVDLAELYPDVGGA